MKYQRSTALTSRSKVKVKINVKVKLKVPWTLHHSDRTYSVLWYLFMSSCLTAAH